MGDGRIGIDVGEQGGLDEETLLKMLRTAPTHDHFSAFFAPLFDVPEDPLLLAVTDLRSHHFARVRRVAVRNVLHGRGQLFNPLIVSTLGNQDASLQCTTLPGMRADRDGHHGNGLIDFDIV